MNVKNYCVVYIIQRIQLLFLFHHNIKCFYYFSSYCAKEDLTFHSNIVDIRVLYKNKNSIYKNAPYVIFSRSSLGCSRARILILSLSLRPASSLYYCRIINRVTVITPRASPLHNFFSYYDISSSSLSVLNTYMHDECFTLMSRTIAASRTVCIVFVCAST